MIINNVKLVLENEVVSGSLEMQNGEIAPLPKARAACRRRWTVKAAGCCRD